MSYEPLFPQGLGARIDWARHIHEKAFRERRTLITPDTFTRHTTQGVFHRPKPVESNPIQQPSGPIDFFKFDIAYTFTADTNPALPDSDSINLAPDRQLAPQTDIDAINKSPNGTLIWPQTACILPGIIKPGWKALIECRQNQYLNNTIPGGDTFPADGITLGYRISVLPGQAVAGTDPPIIVPFEFFSGPLFPPEAYASGGDTWETVSDVFDGSADAAPLFTSADKTYISLHINGPFTTGTDRDLSTYQNYGSSLFPAGTSLSVFGVAWDDASLTSSGG